MGIDPEELASLGRGENLMGFIAQAQEAGMGVTESRNAFRAAGGSVANQIFSDAWAEQAAAAAERQALQGASWAALPSEDVISDVSWGEAGKHYYHFDVTFRVPGTGTGPDNPAEFVQKLMDVKSDVLLTPGEAFAQLADAIGGLRTSTVDTDVYAFAGGQLLNIYRALPRG